MKCQWPWVMTLVVIRILTPSDYGLVAMASVFIALVAIFADSGLGPAIVQRSEIDTLTLRKAFGTVLVIHFVLALLLMLLAPSIGAFYNEERVIAILRVLSLQLIVAGFGVVPDALLQRNLDFRRRSLLDLSSAIVGGASTLGLALLGHAHSRPSRVVPRSGSFVSPPGAGRRNRAGDRAGHRQERRNQHGRPCNGNSGLGRKDRCNGDGAGQDPRRSRWY